MEGQTNSITFSEVKNIILTQAWGCLTQKERTLKTLIMSPQRANWKVALNA